MELVALETVRGVLVGTAAMLLESPAYDDCMLALPAPVVVTVI